MSGRRLLRPLALLLWLAAALRWVAGTPVLGAAIIAVIPINAVLAFLQKRQAERAVEALIQCLPRKDRRIQDRELVPGNVMLVDEDDQISGDARPLSGAANGNRSGRPDEYRAGPGCTAYSVELAR